MAIWVAVEGRRGTDRVGFRREGPFGRLDGGVVSSNATIGSTSINDRLAHYLPTDGRLVDPELSFLVDAWPQLPEAIRAGIVAMVEAACGKRGRS